MTQQPVLPDKLCYGVNESQITLRKGQVPSDILLQGGRC